MKHLDGNQPGHQYLKQLANWNYWLTSETKILDYGCGGGALVYALRDLGLQCYGFDIHDRVDLRSPEDRSLFAFATNSESDYSVTTIPDDLMSLPFPDGTFDIVISEAVIEHVMNLPLMVSEIARVLKPEGICYHTYPGRSLLIEPHMFVPLGTRIKSRWWFYFWALLGIRNEFQCNPERLPAKEVADRNARYAQTGIRFRRTKEILECFDRHFRSVQFRHEASTWPTLETLLRSSNRMQTLAMTQGSDYLLCEGKRTAVRDPIDMAFKARLRRKLTRMFKRHSQTPQRQPRSLGIAVWFGGASTATRRSPGQFSQRSDASTSTTS